jgi:hypothetical protein
MATQYGVQFEALMSEVCRDFGAKLLRSWDPKATKSEVKEFVDEAVANFFKTHVSSPEPEKPKKAAKKSKAVDVTEPEPEKPKKAAKKSKAVEPEPAKAKGKAKKPKCQAVTAKGTPCSKCAAEGEPFCAVHLKKAPAAEKSEKAPAKKGGKGGKASPPKHTHSLTSPPLKENPCELCETHGMPFEVPEYEDMEYAYDPTDPEFVLNEEDFEESDDEDADFDEID